MPHPLATVRPTATNQPRLPPIATRIFGSIATAATLRRRGNRGEQGRLVTP
jgi:hypothetical protein